MRAFLAGGSFTNGAPILETFERPARGYFGYSDEYDLQARGKNQGIENNGVRAYELYATEGADPDPGTDAPVATATELPFEFALGEGDWRVILCYRNGFNVLTENRSSTRIVIDGDGDVTFTPPAAPQQLLAEVDTWDVVITALAIQEPNPPTHFVIRTTQQVSSGSPGIQTTTVAANFDDGIAKLATTHVMDDGLANETGVVLVEVWMRRVEEDESETDGPLISTTANVPEVYSDGGSMNIWEAGDAFQ